MCRRSEHDLYARTNAKPARSLLEVLRDLSGRAGRRSSRRKWFLSRLRSRPAPTKRLTAKVQRRPEARAANQTCVGREKGQADTACSTRGGDHANVACPHVEVGGIALAIIAVIAISYVQFIAASAPPEATEAFDEAPMALYWIMLLVGVAAAIAGFVTGRRPGPS
jgi:hypothetical protein